MTFVGMNWRDLWNTVFIGSSRGVCGKYLPRLKGLISKMEVVTILLQIPAKISRLSRGEGEYL